MRKLLGNIEIQLDKRNTLVFRGARDFHLECTEGFGWLTVEGHPCDIVLAKGESVQIQNDGLGLIQGLPSGSFQLKNMATKIIDHENRVANVTFQYLNLPEQRDGAVMHMLEIANGMVEVFRKRLGSLNPKI
jgi:hypothetical protein